MKAVTIERVSRDKDGHDIVKALIVSNTAPTVLPTTGANVDGMDENQRFAPMSVIYVVGDAANKVYMANESGVFVAQ